MQFIYFVSIRVWSDSGLYWCGEASIWESHLAPDDAILAPVSRFEENALDSAPWDCQLRTDGGSCGCFTPIWQHPNTLIAILPFYMFKSKWISAKVSELVKPWFKECLVAISAPIYYRIQWWVPSPLPILFSITPQYQANNSSEYVYQYPKYIRKLFVTKTKLKR